MRADAPRRVAAAAVSRLCRLEVVCRQVVSAPHGACHFRQRLLARSGSILLFERLQLSGQGTIAEDIANPAREVAHA